MNASFSDEGEIFINGKQVDIKNPNVAIESGIGMVHQHFMLIDNFTIAQKYSVRSRSYK